MRNHIFYAALMVLGFCLLNPQKSLAKEYDIPAIRVEVTIQPDGNVRITEHRTYDFDGSFSWADYRLPLEGFTEITDIRVAESGTDFINRNTEQPGTFSVQTGDGMIQIKWFYTAEDEQRTFTISYTLKGALVHGPQWSEFFWNYISEDREKDTEDLQITMTLPQAVDTDSLHSWMRGPLPKITFRETANGYTATATNLDDDEFVKIRSIFPHAVFDSSAVSITNPDFTLRQAREDEEAHQQKMAAEQQRNARLAGYGEKLAAIVSILSIGAFLFFYRKYGKRHSSGHVSATETIMIPGREKPAVIGWLLWGRNISSAQLMATVLDLARRGYFRIEEQEPEKGWFGDADKIFTISRIHTQPTEKLTDWEAMVKNFISEQIDQDNQRVDKLFSNSSYSASKWFSEWKKQLKNHCQKNNWYDDQSYTGVYANVGVQLALAGLGILAILWTGPLGIIPLILTVALLIGSAGIIRRTEEGEQMYTRWKAYKEGLENAKEYSIGRDLLGRHYIYAVAFGLPKKKIRTILERSDNPGAAIAWIAVYGHSPSAAGMAESLSTLSASGTASFPGASASGASGAGASAGAAGGGAAGGAG